MPAKKPLGLHTRHSTKAEVRERLEAEAALLSDRELPVNEPARLKDHAEAAVVWRRVMREYNRLEAKLVSRLDMDLLIDYCLVMEQIGELDELRSRAREFWELLSDKFNDLHSKGDVLESWKMADKVTNAYNSITKIDARVDAKRKLVFQYRQSLFMTPRSRTGVKPDEDQKKKMAEDPFEEHLNQKLNEVVNKAEDVSGDEA